MSRHAYLIMVHEKFEQVLVLLKLIDDIRNTLYIHIDAKVTDVESFKRDVLINIKYSEVFFVDRVEVYWGDFSQIKATLNLIKEGIKGNFSYYHLLSGVDLPLKSQDDIHKFFDKNNGKEFIHFCNKEFIKKNQKRYLYNWLFVKEIGRVANSKKKKILLYAQKAYIFIQKILLKKERKGNINFSIGSNWFSITHDLAKYVIENESWIYDCFRNGKCVDEVYLQTLVYNSHFYNNCYSIEDVCHSNMRLIDWKRGNPYVFRECDYVELMNSELLFARKFDTEIDSKIINKLVNNVLALDK